MRTIAVPAGGATLSFRVTRDTEQHWDFMFVEAHTVGRRRLDDAARRQRPHELRHRQLVPVRELASAPPVPRPLPDRPRRRHVQPDGHDRRLVGGDRCRATAASSGRSTSRAYAGKQVEVSISYASDDVVQTHGVFVDDIDVVHGRGQRRRSRTTPTRSTAGPCRARRRAARATRTTGRSAPPPTCPRTSASWSRSVVRTRARDHRVPRGQLRPVSVPRRRRHRRSPRRASASRSRTRRARSTRRSSSTTRSGADGVVVHELAHQWYGDSVVRPLLAGHLAERGLRDLRRVAVERARGPRHAAGDLRRDLRGDPGGRPLLAARDRRPGAGPPLRRARSTCAGR